MQNRRKREITFDIQLKTALIGMIDRCVYGGRGEEGYSCIKAMPPKPSLKV